MAYIQQTILNGKPHLKLILKPSMNLCNVALYKSLDWLNLGNRSFASTIEKIQFANV